MSQERQRTNKELGNFLMKQNIKEKIFTDSMSEDSNKSMMSDHSPNEEENEKQIKEKLIKDKTLLNMFFNTNKNENKIKSEENLMRYNLSCQDEFDMEIINKIINIDEAFLCEDCKPIVRLNEKETICRESSIFKSKPNKSYNCYNLTPENTASDFIIPSMSQYKHIKKFEVSKTKKTRKMDRDCIHKKIKARLFKYVKDKMKILILPELSNLKIPQNIISDVTFNFNKDLLNRSIQSIFVERYFYFNSKKNLQKICLEGKLEELMFFLQRSVKDCFEEYLKSENFEKDIKKFQNESYINTFKDYSFGFIEYYNQPPNYKRMKRKNFENSDSKSNS